MGKILQTELGEKLHFVSKYLGWFRSIPLDLSPKEQKKLLSALKTPQQTQLLIQSPHVDIVDAVRYPSSENRRVILKRLLRNQSLAPQKIEDLILFLTPYLGFPSVMAALADLRCFAKQPDYGEDSKPKQASVMIELYGPHLASVVYDRLEEISRRFNIFAQTIAYEKIWAAHDISLRQKSLVTVTVLLAIGREEQASIHLKGFKNLGGTRQEAEDLVALLGVEKVPFDKGKANNVISSVFGGENSTRALPIEEQLIVKFVANKLTGRAAQSLGFDSRMLMGIERQMITYAGLEIDTENDGEII